MLRIGIEYIARNHIWSLLRVNVFQGMPGAPNMKMYSREELMNMKTIGGEDNEDDDDEENDDTEAELPPNLVLTSPLKFLLYK